MKSLIALLLVFACLGGDSPVIKDESDPEANLNTPVHETWAGTISDIFTETIEVEIKFPDSIRFTFDDDTTYWKHDSYTGETEEITRKDLQAGQWVEIECTRYPDSDLRSMLTITVIEHTLTDVSSPNLNMQTLKDLVDRDRENLTWADFSSYYC